MPGFRCARVHPPYRRERAADELGKAGKLAGKTVLKPRGAWFFFVCVIISIIIIVIILDSLHVSMSRWPEL